MKNCVQDEGDVLDLPAPYAVTSGSGVKIGNIIGVCATDAAQNATVAVVVEGVFDVAKVSAQAWTVGALVYWDDAAKNFTTTSTSNTLAGVATAVAANPSATGRVKL